MEAGNGFWFGSNAHLITLLELGAGFVMGRERIISNKSADFLWPEKVSAANVLRYDERG